jgi:hypothetical protein
MTSNSKRARHARSLEQVLHVGGVSTSGLADLLSKARSLDLERASRWALREADDVAFSQVRAVVEVPLTDGGSFLWEFADPISLLELAVVNNRRVSALFAEGLRRRPPTVDNPWRLVIAHDAFIPGIAPKVGNALWLCETSQYVRPRRTTSIIYLGRSPKLQYVTHQA